MLRRPGPPSASIFFFFNDTATTEIYTLSLHDALPILRHRHQQERDDEKRHADSQQPIGEECPGPLALEARPDKEDRKSTRLNSSHSQISYAVFCLKKKKKSDCRIWIYAKKRTTPQ